MFNNTSTRIFRPSTAIEKVVRMVEKAKKVLRMGHLKEKSDDWSELSNAAYQKIYDIMTTDLPDAVKNKVLFLRKLMTRGWKLSVNLLLLKSTVTYGSKSMPPMPGVLRRAIWIVYQIRTVLYGSTRSCSLPFCWRIAYFVTQNAP